ncbi:MAG: homoserine O-succinyltransferase [Mogibacterium sp.]|nr:homoserine O-succinyltransferase [Mogibacterium sp.]
MPLIIPDSLPAADMLRSENIFVMDRARASTQDIRPLKVIIVNLMPTKIATETQLARVLANSPLQIEMKLVTMDSHTSTHVSQEHMESFYTTLDEFRDEYFDGMILTGSPVEKLEFEQVDYWSELCELFEFAKTHVYSNMFICWGAQAAMYYYYGIQKHELDKKLFGVYEQQNVRPHSPLMRGFDEVFYAPHSRHTEIRKSDIEARPELRILAESPESGPHIVATDNGRQIFLFGHQEYDRNTLADEYFRDKDKGLDIDVPVNYFRNDDPEQGILFRWRSHANLLFSNWLNYYLYQAVPYNLDDLRDGKEDAWREAFVDERVEV